MTSLLTPRVKEVLRQSGYPHFFIDEDIYQIILAIYADYQIGLSQSAKELLKIFGGREIFYSHNTESHRNSAYHVSFYYRIENFGGVPKPADIQHQQDVIHALTQKLGVKTLIPFAFMTDNLMTFYLDEQDRIFGEAENHIIGYQGRTLSDSLDKLLNGEATVIHEPESLQAIYLRQKYGKK